jgi:RNA polymerase sigma-70 factor (ECF subfamily)
VENTDDGSLVELTLRGKTRAFEELVRRYQRPVYTLAYRMLNSREDAEDIAQEAWLRAYSSLKAFDTTRPFLRWLLKMTSNLCIDRLRHEKGHQNVELDDATDAILLNDGTIYTTPDTELDRKERTSQVEAAIAALAPHYRAVVLLRYSNDLSCEEIAETLGIPIGTVVGRLFRARRLLARQLQDLVEEKYHDE